MKLSKPRSSSASTRARRPTKPKSPASPIAPPPLLPRRIQSVADLRRFQRVMAQALFRPLTARDGLQPRWTDGRPTARVAAEFIKPNALLTSLERLEIYAKSYWFRVLDCLFDDYPGLRAILGQRRFLKLITAFLAAHPSSSFTLRNLGGRLPQFIVDQPALAGLHARLAAEMARFEWAQVVAFDGESRPVLDAADLAAADPARLRVGLQPYVTLLECRYPVDEFSLALKKRDTALRGEASNAPVGPPKGSRAAARPRLPRPSPTWVAVHRQENMLFFKRLEPEAFALLAGLRDGRPLAAACAKALRNADPAVDWAGRVRAWFTTWQALGWFCRREAKRGRA